MPYRDPDAGAFPISGARLLDEGSRKLPKDSNGEVLPIHCCVINHPELNSLEQQVLIPCHGSSG